MPNQKTKTPHLVLTAETEDFDEEIPKQFREEGFNTAYVPLLNGGQDFVNRVHRTGDGFGVSEYYGIVGKAAELSVIQGITTDKTDDRQHMAMQPP